MLHKQKLGEAPTSGIEIIMGISAFISICFLIKAITVGAQKCYFPDGTEVNDDTPCRPQSSDQTSVCCGESDVCLGNSLCLIQTGYGAIARGSCTDPTWQSDDCPQYCQDVNPNSSVPIFAVQDGFHFCCADFDSSTNQCRFSTRGSTVPFQVPAGKVLFNRTTGPTSPSSVEVITANVSSSSLVTVTDLSTATTTDTVSSIATDLFTATVSSTTTSLTVSTIPSDHPAYHNSPPSSEKSTGLGIGVPLGLALLGTLSLLWRQRTRELGARTEARAWKEKYDELKKQNGRGLTVGVGEGQTPELHESWRPNEIGGRNIHEMVGTRNWTVWI